MSEVNSTAPKKKNRKGLTPEQKEHHRKYCREWYEKNHQPREKLTPEQLEIERARGRKGWHGSIAHLTPEQLKEVRDKKQEYSRQYRLKYPDRAKASAKKSKEKHKGAIKEWSKQQYWKHRETFLANARTRYHTNKAMVDGLKAGQTCKYCPENDPICLDYHHRNPADKIENIGAAAKRWTDQAKILAEIAKCDLVCCNCHRKLHRNDDRAANGHKGGTMAGRGRKLKRVNRRVKDVIEMPLFVDHL